MPAAVSPAILSGLIDRFGEVPRYTSYPTAPHFRPVEEDTAWRGWLAAIPGQTSLSLYLHVPFCRSMCWYCGCATQVAKGDDGIRDYVEAMLAEIALTAKNLPPQAQVSHIHWGGGTPTIVGADGLRHITERLAAQFSFAPDIEIAVEVDPRRFDAGLARSFADCGVNRASLGVQSFDPAVQQAINRIQPLAQVRQTVDRLQEAGITAINFDLLYGLPQQTEASLADTISQVEMLSPSRIALFGYAHVPWMRPHQKKIETAKLPGSGQRMLQFLQAERLLNQAGYASIGLDHFARPDDPLAVAAREGRLHRNFQGYTTDKAETLIGFGASSISQLAQGYASNLRSPVAWRRAVDSGRLPTERMLPVTAEDRLRGAVIERLMCNLQVDLEVEAAQAGLPAGPLYEGLDALQPIVDAGLMQIEGGRLTVLPQARLLLRQICSRFDSYLRPGSGIRHAAA